MKNLIYILLISFLVGVIFFSCKPEENIDPELGTLPNSEMATFEVQPKADNPNIIVLKNTSGGFNATWDFGNGQSATGNQVEAQYPLEGKYTVKMTMYNKNGSAASTKTITIAQTNYIMLNRPDYNLLTGGASKPNGKTWIIDKDFAAHMGVGPAAGSTPEWWSAPPNDKAGLGLYDDEYTFKLQGLGMDIKTNGDVFANGASSGDIGGTGTGDQKVSYTAPTGTTWSIAEEGGKKFLIISKNAFLGFYTGVSKYEILKLEENELHIKFLDSKNHANAWYHILIPKGYSRPVVPPAYKIEDIADGFESTLGLTFINDGGGSIVKAYDNPAPVGLNTSAKVAKYTKANGNTAAFANVQLRFDYKLDIRQRKVFKLKVFIPGFNDFTTEAAESWQSYKTLQKQVSLKLQNKSLGGNAWTTQAEVKNTNVPTDQWVELTFDFSAFSTRDDFDQLVIQVGGEAIYTSGIFYLDDLQLL